MRESRIVYVGIKGTVIALNAETGGQLWATTLRGADFVSVFVDGDKIFAATYGEMFCLDRKTGGGLWHNQLKGYGRGLVSIATDNGNSTVETLAAEKARRDAEAAAAATTVVTVG